MQTPYLHTKNVHRFKTSSLCPRPSVGPQTSPKNVQIYFLLVRIKIKHMEMAIIRRETAGTGSNQYNESETITKYEVMDGAPAKGK